MDVKVKVLIPVVGILLMATVVGRYLYVGANQLTIPKERRRLAPDFSITDIRQNAVHLSDHRGRVLVLTFWTTWCEACKSELQWFNEMIKTFNGKGLDIVSVAIDRGGWQAVAPLVEQSGLTYTAGVGTEQVTMKFGGLAGFPTTFLIDRTGRIAWISGTVNRRTFPEAIRHLLRE